MSEILNRLEKPMDVNVWDLVSQVIESRRDPLDLVREQLSNICALEVQAKNAYITFYNDPDYGPSFIFKDDGIGMNFTNDPNHLGRLDRFLAMAYSGHAGYKTDEFGQKGLGAKLALNCHRLEIKTKSRADGKSYMVFVDGPLEALKNSRQPVFKIIPDAGLPSPGTEVKILGYERGEGKSNYDFEHVKRYLYFSTVVGHTRPRQMPIIHLKINDIQDILPTGFPYLRCPPNSDWKTYVLADPIELSEEASGIQVKVALKGGFTLETGDTNITGPYTLTQKTSGIFLSIKGIPFLWLDINSFRGKFSTLQYKFCRFVAECDELFDQMDLARGSYQPGPVTTTFEKLLKKCFNDLADRQEWKIFLHEREKQEQIKKRESLDERKNFLNALSQKFVYLKGTGRLLHRVPDNEHDTLALLWKLEGAGAIPLPLFESLEHTAMEGIDIIANVRWRQDGDTQHLIPIEAEDTYEEFFDHGHNPNQTGAILCWIIEDPDVPELEQTDRPYLLFLKTPDKKIPVLVMSRFPTIEIRPRQVGQ